MPDFTDSRTAQVAGVHETSEWRRTSVFELDPANVPTSELRRSFARLSLLYQLANQICSDTEEDSVFHTILKAVVDLLNTERAFIATLWKGNLTPRAMHNIDLPESAELWPVSTTMIRRSLNERLVILTSDATCDDRYGNVPSVGRHSIRSVMCCPLGVQQNVRGVIYVDNRAATKAFTAADREFLNALSHFASVAVENAEERRRLAIARELAEAQLNAVAGELSSGEEAIGVSSAITRAYLKAKRVAKKEVTILLIGETGTGKEVFSRCIHSWSQRADGPFVALNLAAFSSTLIESELFGHVKGAFTGADNARVGWLELARGGTLLLDEVQDIPADVQPKLLRVLEQRAFQPVGSSKTIEADVRIICASNKDLEQQVRQGTFREDLYYRLNAVTLELPPLRDRREDIPLLIEHFLKKCESQKAFDAESLAYLTTYGWPGNVRELKNTVEGLDALVDEGTIHASDLPRRITKREVERPMSGSFEPLKELLGRVEKQHILRAIELANGNNEVAIDMLGIARATFFKRKKEYEAESV